MAHLPEPSLGSQAARAGWEPGIPKMNVALEPGGLTWSQLSVTRDASHSPSAEGEGGVGVRIVWMLRRRQEQRHILFT